MILGGANFFSKIIYKEEDNLLQFFFNFIKFKTPFRNNHLQLK